MAPVIDLDPIVPSIPDVEGKYSEYQWAFRTNEKNPKITVFKKQGETSTELGWSLVPLNNERTLWVLPTHYWDYSASEYDFYYESDTCERYLIEAFLKSEDFDKPFNGEQITYNNVTYNLVVDRYHDYISNIIYPDNTQYNIIDNNAVHLTGDETIYGEKTFNDKVTVNSDLQVYKNIRQSRSALTKGTNPSDSYYMGLIYDDGSPYPSGQEYNNENRFGLFETSVDSNGNVSTYMGAYKNEASSEINSQIKIIYPASGNPYTEAPTPTATTQTSGSGSAQIATTGWVNSVGNNIIHKTDYETYTGVKSNQITLNLNRENYMATNDFQITNLDQTVAPQYRQQIYTDIVRDKNDNYFSWITTNYSTTREVSTSLTSRCKNSNNTSNVNASLSVVANPDGTTYATAPTPSSTSDYSGKIATTQWVKNSIRGKILATNLSQKTGVITLNESIQNFPILLFGIGAVASYQYSTCVVTPFMGRLNSYRDFNWQINGDTIRLNYTNGQTSATTQMITLKITSNVSVEIVTNTGNMEIRGVFGLSFN